MLPIVNYIGGTKERKGMSITLYGFFFGR